MNGTFFSGFLKAFQAKLHSDVSDYSVRILIVIFFIIPQLIFARNNQKNYELFSLSDVAFVVEVGIYLLILADVGMHNYYLCMYVCNPFIFFY